MEDRLKEISRLRKKAHTTLVKKKSRVYEAFLEMEQATYLDGKLKRKEKELIAVGIEMGGGPATAHARFALEALESLGLNE